MGGVPRRVAGVGGGGGGGRVKLDNDTGFPEESISFTCFCAGGWYEVRKARGGRGGSV